MSIDERMIPVVADVLRDEQVDCGGAYGLVAEAILVALAQARKPKVQITIDPAPPRVQMVPVLRPCPRCGHR